MRCDFLEFPLFIFCILELFWAFLLYFIVHVTDI